MTAKSVGILAALILATTKARGASEEWYGQTTQRLHQEQDRSEALIHHLKIQAGLVDVPHAKAKDSEAQTPLFRVHDDLSIKIPAGKLLYGKIFNRLVVGSDGSPALIELDSRQGRYSGLRVIGQAHQAGTPGRLIIEITRILLRDGRSVTIQASALDQDGASGLEAQVFSSKALAVAGAMTSSFISGAAASQQTQTTNAFGFSQQQLTGRNAILQGLSQTAADQSKRLIEEATAEKPVLVVESQTPVTVLIQEEARF